MTLMRYEPWTMLNRLQRELDQTFDRVRGEGEEEGALMQAAWTPAVDIKEEDDRYVVHADVPGVSPEDIEVTAESGTLEIKGSRKHESRTSEAGYTRVERSSGSFYRSFRLPETVDEDNIRARCNNGELEITLPKKEQPGARRITVEG